MGHHVGYPTVETQFYKFAVQRFYVLSDILFQKNREKRIATVQIDYLLGRYSYLKHVYASCCFLTRWLTALI